MQQFNLSPDEELERRHVSELISALRFENGLTESSSWEECMDLFLGIKEVGRDLNYRRKVIFQISPLNVRQRMTAPTFTSTVKILSNSNGKNSQHTERLSPLALPLSPRPKMVASVVNGVIYVRHEIA